jgi:hypothetical protein
MNQLKSMLQCQFCVNFVIHQPSEQEVEEHPRTFMARLSCTEHRPIIHSGSCDRYDEMMTPFFGDQPEEK